MPIASAFTLAFISFETNITFFSCCCRTYAVINILLSTTSDDNPNSLIAWDRSILAMILIRPPPSVATPLPSLPFLLKLSRRLMASRALRPFSSWSFLNASSSSITSIGRITSLSVKARSAAELCRSTFVSNTNIFFIYLFYPFA